MVLRCTDKLMLITITLTSGLDVLRALNSTANIKALRGSLGALSVNKLSHIPKLQPISAVYENQ